MIEKGRSGKPARKKSRDSASDNRPAQKSSVLGRVLKSMILMGLLAVVVAGGVFFYMQNAMQMPGPLTSTKVITIKRGMSTVPIAQLLANEGVISSPGVFMIASYGLRPMRGSLKAGEFEFSPKASMSQVLRALQAGKSRGYKVTIPEGWTTQRAIKRIAANKVLKGNISFKPAEGSLLPDTYVFQRGTTRDGLIKRMQAAQIKLLDGLWDNRQKNLPIKTRAQALTLASIVERETGISAERARVAAVFVNRLNKKMRLQSDPTIIYGIVGGKGRMNRPISKKDIAKKTKYNTYQIDGLPPTPIANPGRAAIAAVLNPDKSKELFFVADGSGGHAFAKTLKGHNANVTRWRKIERERKKLAAAKKKSHQASHKVSQKDSQKESAAATTGSSIPAKNKKAVPLPKTKPKQN